MNAAPDAGDIVWTDFSPQSGREQSGRRPALVLTKHKYNERIGLMVVCPITSRPKGYAFEVALPDECGVEGVILADHVKSIDWRTRGASPAGRVPEETILDVLAKLMALLDVP